MSYLKAQKRKVDFKHEQLGCFHFISFKRQTADNCRQNLQPLEVSCLFAALKQNASVSALALNLSPCKTYRIYSGGEGGKQSCTQQSAGARGKQRLDVSSCHELPRSPPPNKRRASRTAGYLARHAKAIDGQMKTIGRGQELLFRTPPSLHPPLQSANKIQCSAVVEVCSSSCDTESSKKNSQYETLKHSREQTSLQSLNLWPSRNTQG